MKFTKFVKSLASEGVIYETNQILESVGSLPFPFSWLSPIP